jgi:hypothetical protein
MGTNYYWYGPCRECGALRQLHIGKSSAGWYFTLHVIPGVINTLDDWKKRFEDDTGFIMNEYREIVSPNSMLEIITERGVETQLEYDEEFLRRNHAEVGIRGLLRHKMNPKFDVEGVNPRLAIDYGFVGHSDGTWSYFVGEFL